MSRLLAMLDTPEALFALGWALVVLGLALRSWSAALVTGGGLLLAVVLLGALRKA